MRLFAGPARPWLQAVAVACLVAAYGPSHAAAPGDDEPDTPAPDAAGPTAGENETRAAGVLLVDDSAATVTDALQGREGLRIQTLCTHCNSANIQVGGLAEDLVPLTRDGFPVVGGVATTFILGILPADTVASAQVFRGPGDAARSNAAAGGEVSLAGASVNELGWIDLFAEVGSFSLARGTVRIAGSIAPRVDGAVVLGRTEAEVVDDDGDGWHDVPDVDREFGEGSLTLHLTPDHTVNLGASYIDEVNLDARGAFDVFRFVSQGQDSWTREDVFFDRVEYRAAWEWRLKEGGSLSARVQRATRHQTVRSQLTVLPGGFGEGADELIDRFRIREDSSWSTLVYQRPVGLEWRITAGIEERDFEIDASTREPLDAVVGASRVRGFEEVPMTSAYVDLGWSFAQSFDLGFGLRWDDAEMVTRLFDPEPVATRRTADEFSPRLNLRYFPSRGWTIRIVAGDTFRPPKPILAEVCCGQRYQTTERVRPETGRTLGIETVYAPTPRLRASVYAARTRFDDHILSVVGSSQAFTQTYALANIPEAEAERVEFAVRWSPLDSLTLDGSMGWLSFENTGEEQVEVFVTPPSFAGPIVVPIGIRRVPYRPTRTASISADLRLPGKLRLGAQAGYTGRMQIQQFTRLALDSELDTAGLRWTPGFWLLSLSTELPLTRRVTLLAAVDNLTDRLQNDLGDPTTDYNWGPLAGRSWRTGLRFHLDRP